MFIVKTQWSFVAAYSTETIETITPKRPVKEKT